jgi:hypothetical protein
MADSVQGPGGPLAVSVHLVLDDRAHADRDDRADGDGTKAGPEGDAQDKAGPQANPVAGVVLKSLDQAALPRVLVGANGGNGDSRDQGSPAQPFNGVQVSYAGTLGNEVFSTTFR